MKVALITGSYPPDICGVSDYTEKLEYHLRIQGVDIQIYTGKQWGIRSALRNASELACINADVVHMQYPATGYGWKLGPQSLALLRPMVLTIHEASQSHPLRQLSLYPFSFRAQKIVFTNEYERAYAHRFAPWIRSSSTLIPIGSNITQLPNQMLRLKDTVTYFGLIRSDKGIEQVIELARLVHRSACPWRIRIIGKLMPGQEKFYERLRMQASGLDIDWLIGLGDEALSLELASSDIAYLPFPDGASERRSSLIALLSNGAAVVTTRGEHSPSLMNNAVLFCKSPTEALALIESLNANSARKQILQERARSYARKFEWEEIAKQHIALYNGIIGHITPPA